VDDLSLIAVAALLARGVPTARKDGGPDRSVRRSSVRDRGRGPEGQRIALWVTAERERRPRDE